MLFSPLEQFEPIPILINFNYGFFYIMFTNVTFILFFIFIIFFFVNGPTISGLSILNFEKSLDNNNNKILLGRNINNLTSFCISKKVSYFMDYLFNFYKTLNLFSYIKFNKGLITFIKYNFNITIIFVYKLFHQKNYCSTINEDIYNYILNKENNLTNFENRLQFIKFKKNIYLKKINLDSNISLEFIRFSILIFFYTKKLISSIYNNVLVIIYQFGLNIVLSTFCSSNLKKSLKYFPFFLSMFFFIIILNCIGLVPYSSTIASYLSVTLFLTFIIIAAAYITVFSLHGLEFFGLFMPQGCPFFLIFFLIPVEFISYVFRMVSLSARLFANMMAGHVLLSVLAGFSWVMFNSLDSFITILGIIPLIIIFLLFFLETGVALVQAVVFTILSCMYLDEAISLSH